MATVIKKPSTTRIDTLCEHMKKDSMWNLAHLYKYCPECGQSLHREEESEYNACSACAQPVLKPTQAYCGFCGEKFTGGKYD